MRFGARITAAVAMGLTLDATAAPTAVLASSLAPSGTGNLHLRGGFPGQNLIGGGLDILSKLGGHRNGDDKTVPKASAAAASSREVDLMARYLQNKKKEDEVGQEEAAARQRCCPGQRPGACVQARDEPGYRGTNRHSCLVSLNGFRSTCAEMQASSASDSRRRLGVSLALRTWATRVSLIRFGAPAVISSRIILLPRRMNLHAWFCLDACVRAAESLPWRRRF